MPCLTDERRIGLVTQRRRELQMLWTVLILLLTLWLLGMIWHVGAFIHLILMAAFVVFLIELFSGRRAAL
jgi:uncharacterized protein DUF5670